MIQGGGDGVYANSGSCVAAAMYCEHERQELMEKGFKPEAFFHQYSDFVSTGEVIDRIDHNQKKLSNKDAKFYVITVNPSAEEQRKMGDTMDERIANFKNYIRYGVMDEYAKNFKRDLTANDIMYYAYVHVNRGNKEGEQMHAHIIVSRRDMDNAISLSPKTNHRGGKGVIAHGFDRDRFNNNCEIAFDNMMNYTRAFEESYEYLNAKKNGTFRDIANVTAKAAELEYGVDLSDWEIPNLKKIYEAYVDKGLEIISISIDKEDKAWQKALDEEQLPWPNLIDRQELFGEQFYGRTIPAIFLVTEDGIVQYDKLRGQALSDKIAEILN